MSLSVRSLYIYRRSATFFSDASATRGAKWPQTWIAPYARADFHSARADGTAEIPANYNAVDLSRPTLSTSSSEIGNTFRPRFPIEYFRWTLDAGAGANERGIRCPGYLAVVSLPIYFRGSKFPREPCVRKADMILREFN